jgi:hypothetical protein
VIRVYDDAGNVIETHEHMGEFKECSEPLSTAGVLGDPRPVPPNVTYTRDDDQHVEDHHRYSREQNQELHTYLLGAFDNVTIVFLLRLFCLLLGKNCLP